MILKPFHDNVFVEREKQEEKTTPSGLILTADAQNVPDTALVIAVGPGRVLSDGTKVKPAVKVGDRVLIGRFSGIEVTWNDEKRLVVPWGDILGVVKENKKAEDLPKKKGC